jgi:hypothetical protein
MQDNPYFMVGLAKKRLDLDDLRASVLLLGRAVLSIGSAVAAMQREHDEKVEAEVAKQVIDRLSAAQGYIEEAVNYLTPTETNTDAGTQS